MVASPIVRDGDVVAVVVTDSPTGGCAPASCAAGCVIAAGELAATILAVAAARPPHRLGAAPGAGPGPRHARHRHRPADVPGRRGRRPAGAAVVWHGRSTRWPTTSRTSLEQQRAFVADASHQLRNPLSALLLRIELLALELPDGNAEIVSVRTEGKRLATVLDDLLGLALAEHTVAAAAADRRRRAGRRTGRGLESRGRRSAA